MDHQVQAIVVDAGSGRIRAGFAGEDSPRSDFPSVVGRPREKTTAENWVVGEEAQWARERFSLKYPIKKGQVRDWDSMEKIYHHTFFEELRVEPGEESVLLTDSPLMCMRSRETMIQLMFETFGFASMYIMTQPVLALFASGRTTGIVVDSGEEVTYVQPFSQGYEQPMGYYRLEIGGSNVTQQLTTLLNARGPDQFTTTADRELVRDLKEQLCYVSQDLITANQTASSPPEKSYKLPDGQVLTLGSELFKSPEVMFQPHLIGSEIPGIHESTYAAILRSNATIRAQLFENVLLSGGNTLFPGFADRLHKELAALAPPDTKINIIAPSERLYTSWIGGSILASLPVFQSKWVSKAIFDEHGPFYVYRQLHYWT